MSHGVISNKRYIVLGIIGFLLGRVFLYSVNPFAIAYFSIFCTEKKGKGLVAACVIAGMATAEEGMPLLKYLLLFAILFIADYITGKGKEHSYKESLKKVSMEPGKSSMTKPFVTAFCAGGISLILGITGGIFSFNPMEVIALSILESIAVIALVGIFQSSVRFLLYDNVDKILGNEELISILLLIMVSLIGLPHYFDGFFSVAETVSYFIVLYVGFRYGASAGAIAGAFGGILGALLGDGMVVIGLYCLLGIGVGLFREGGKFIAAVAYFIMGVILAYAFQEEIMGIVELRGIVSAVIIFLSLPKSSLRMIHIDFDKEDENPFIKEDIRTLANYKIENFSNAFRRLSKSISAFGEKDEQMTLVQMQCLFDDLSERICKNCVNCSYCWDKHYEETYHSIRNILHLASEQGVIDIMEVEGYFERRCIRLNEYVERLNEDMKTIKTDRSMRNKMAESRNVLGNQMEEVASILGNFSKEITHVEERSKDEKRMLILALKQAGLQVKKISIIEKRKGRLEVQFQGRVKGKNCI
ncbi:MAG: hypothetical protein LBR68_07970, partial [Lachnoclostridium sp.]|nr:hypothetical protein [Lachnoclostridium sp.]